MLTSLVDILRKLGHCSMTSHYCSSITRLSEDNGQKNPMSEHPMRRDAFITHHTLYHYIKTSKNSPKLQRNGPIFKKSTSQADDIIHDACMKFENYLIQTVGEDAFCSYCILYNYFKISKTRKKSKIL